MEKLSIRTDFTSGIDRIGPPDLDLDSADDVTMTAVADVVTLDLGDAGGGLILFAYPRVAPEARFFLV